MKQYITPESEIDRFEAEDVITTSPAGSDTNGVEGGDDL